MLVDESLQQQQQQQSFSFDPSSLDDFFNLDALSGNSQPALSASGSQSSASPRSPFTFQGMPLTPPPVFSVPPPSVADDALFNLFLEDEFSKAPPMLPGVPQYDFFANMGAPAGPSVVIGLSSSPEASSSGTSPVNFAHSPQPSFGIDPQLVGTPATSKALSDFDEEEGHSSMSHSIQEEEEEKEDDPPVTEGKSATRGKISRKGTVLSGGVKKLSAVVSDKENGAGKDGKSKDTAPLKILEPEDWRPSPEEYKKMSSKEKRQLRNKISARNFRVRRKEYINTLEGDIAERDRLIDAIRAELGSSKSENIALRQEIAALKKCLLEGRGLPDLPPPADLPPSPASPPVPTSSTSSATPSSSSIVTPNTQKDLPTSPRISNRPFWGGLGGMGVTPVHTTFIPPIAVLASKASSASSSPILQPSIFYEETVRSRALQENLNPGLNPSLPSNLVEKKGSASIVPALSHLSNIGNIGAFDTFADTNPFTLKSLDAYRMQLWGKMAAQHSTTAHSQQTYTPPQSPPLAPTGLAGGLRPHYFMGSTKLGGVLSPKASTVGIGAGAYPTPPSSPPPSLSLSSSSHPSTGSAREQAAIAVLASQTLLGKLGQAFWEAFSGSSSASPSPHLAPASAVMNKQWDTEKVRKVLEGRAIIKVVDVEPVQSIAPPPPLTPSTQKMKGPEKSKTGGQSCALTDILEESMRSLTLGKKMN
ncbi:hypothetical protein ID866_7781 [Astraeus odoratus]|nr:hypothetical protein ID866_7781 [Astraeus odoratus]